MKSVWIVEQGEYSDYGILAIFGTEAQAKEFCNHRKGGGGHAATYREWPLDTWTTDQASFQFEFDLNGNIVSETEEASTDDPSDEIQQNRWQRKSITIQVNRGPRDRAVKIASERYMKLRAFLDEATERADRALPNVAEHLRTTTSLMVAEVLAGLAPMPEPPRCGFDEYVLAALGVKKS